MFLVRTIRRRLVSGFLVALLLMLFLAGAGILGVVWHQDSVDDLNFLLYRSPNRDHLSIAIHRVSSQLFQQLDLSQPQAVAILQSNYAMRVDAAFAELAEFRGRIEKLPHSPELYQQRNHVLSRLDGTAGELARLAALGPRIPVVKTAEDRASLENLRSYAQVIVGKAQNLLDHLPAYEQRHWLKQSLEKEKRRSDRLLQVILLVAGTSIGVYSLTIFLGFRWVSAPLRAIAKDAIRIANGDNSFRVRHPFRWHDEFADLVDGVNCMADRFQQSKEDLQAMVKERSEQLVRSERLAAVGFLAAGVAHEINNPLSIISMASESIQMRMYDYPDCSPQDVEEMRERLAMIRSESRRCGEITRRMLDFSRPEKYEMSVGDLTRVIHEVIEMLSHLGTYSDRTIEFRQDTPVTIQMNSTRVKQIMLNLLANALQATGAGGHVRVCVQEQVDFVNIVIQDDGIGMDETTLEHIFDPFYTTKDTGQGTGLGLFITHRLVEDHHGTIVPTSDGRGQGSTFRIRLPRRQPVANAA
ncbi:MAG: HAMP domain-containing histidine kinase [Planctomycetaceae bacterium]|nr:HAMP domain-containing histidine kinase [Planctomycetaceae bacterium]